MSKTLEKLRELRAKPFNWETLIKVLDEVEQELEYAEKCHKLQEQLGCPLETLFKALNGFYIDEYGYVSNDDDFIYLRKDDSGYYLKVVIHPSKPIPPIFYGYCDIHYLKDYKKTWWLRKDKSELI